MLCSRLNAALLLAATCLLVDSGSATPQHSYPAAVIKREITCDEIYNVQRLSCSSGVITVKSALYGRADRETCSEGKPPQQLASIHCSQLGTLHVFKRICDGKRECEINTVTVRTSDPCFGIFKYVDTTYSCSPASHSHTYYSVACEDSYASLQCDRGQVISVSSAYYGRRDQTTCATGRPASQVKTVTCSKYIGKVAESCNGKTSCAIKVRGSTFGDPCFGTYKYLDVTYSCHYPGFYPQV